MWFYWLLTALIALMLAGGIFFGGIFTLILVPLAVIAVAAGIAYVATAGAAQRRTGADTDPAGSARGSATSTSQTPPPRRPSRPGELVDARRGRQ
jgi:hypothetical protein